MAILIRIIDRTFKPVDVLTNDAPNGLTLYDDQLKTSIASGLYTLELKVHKTNDHRSQALEVGNMLEMYNKNRKQLLLTITNVVENRYEKTIFAEDANISMLNGFADPIETPNSRERLSYYTNALLEGTDYEVLVDESDTTKVVEFQGSERRLEMLRKLATEFGVELEFSVRYKVGFPPVFYVSFLKYRFEGSFGFRVSSDDLLGPVEKTVDYYNVITKLNVRGKQKEEKTQTVTPKQPAPKPQPQVDNLIEKVIEIAMAQRGKRYVWGANGPANFDCSGLMNYSFKNAGYTNWPNWRCTTNTYWSQQGPFYRVNSNERKRGDLVLMDTGYTWPGDANHVGLYLGNGEMVHAGDPVQVAKTSHFTVLGYVRVRKP